MERNFKNSKLSFKMVSAGFLYAKGDPSGVADRPFFVRMVGSSADLGKRGI